MGTQNTILVVDDDIKVTETLSRILSRFGYDCTMAFNAQEALSILEKDTIPVVITDIRMPGMDGMELLKQIKERWRDTDVVIITAHSDEYGFTSVIAAGASDFLIKPFSNEELQAKVARIVRERQLRSNLIESRNKLGAILDGIKDSMYIVDHNFIIQSANKAFAESIGSPIRDTIGKHCYQLLHGQDAPCTGDNHLCPVQKCFSTGSPESAIHENLLGSNIKYSEVSVTPLIEGGEITRVIVVNRDISERIKSTKQATLLHEFAESSNQGLGMSNLDGYFTYVNPSLCRFFGEEKPEDVIGKNIDNYYTEEQMLKFKNEILPAVLEHGNLVVDMPLFSNGKVTPTIHSVSVIRDEKGDPLYFANMITDITTHKEAEEKLWRINDSLNNIIESSLDGIMVTDGVGNVTRVNKAFLEMIGCSEEEVVGKHTMELSPINEGERYACITGEVVDIDKEYIDYSKEMISRLLEETKMRNWRSYYIRKDGKLLPVEQSIVCRYNEKGERTGAIAIIRDIAKREIAEKELKASKDFLENVIESSKDGIVINDETGCILSINTALEEMSKFKKEELIGKHISTLSYEDEETRKKVIRNFEELLELGFTSYESKNRTKEGRIIDVEYNSSLIKDDKGNYIAGVSIIRDITERKRIETELRKSEGRYHNLIEFANAGIVVAEKGVITQVNKKAEEIYGYAKDELVGQSPNILVPDKYQKEHRELLNKAIAQKKELQKYFEEEGIRKDGSLLPVEISFSLSVEEEDRTIAVIRDISERKGVEELLRKRVSELSVLNIISETLSNSLDLNVILKSTFQKVLKTTGLDCGAILLLNEKGDRFELKASMGFNSEALKEGTTIALDAGVSSTAVRSRKPVLIEEMGKCDMPGIEILREEKVKNFISIPIVSRKKVSGTINLGSHKKHSFSDEEINLITSISNQISLAIDNARLFEETKNTLDELKQTQSYLLQSEKMASIGQLAAGVAHEINNPTGFVNSNLNSLNKYSSKMLELMKKYEEGFSVLKDNGNEKATSFYTEVEELKKTLKIDFIMKDFQKIIADSLEGTGRIKKIVSDLKNFSHVDQEELKLADINEGIKSTLNVVWNELKYKCTVEKDFGDIPKLFCNLGQLNQVFMNLLVNAAQAIEERGTIKISTRCLNGQSADGQNCIEIKISDTGKGIPGDKLKRIFEPFFTTKDVGKGTGLGLSIAYDIIQKHKGEIRVRSDVGKGTTFTIQLPFLEVEEKGQRLAIDQ